MNFQCTSTEEHKAMKEGQENKVRNFFRILISSDHDIDFQQMGTE